MNDKNQRNCAENGCGCGTIDREELLCDEELHEIYRNATAGKESVEIVRPMSEDRCFRKVLMKQANEYSDFIEKTEQYAKDNGIDLKSVSPFAKGMMYVTTMLNTLTDKSTSKLAEVMLQGINMGTISVTRVVNKMSDSGKNCPIANDMLALLNRNAEEMKMFL